MNFELRPGPVFRRWDGGTAIVAAPGPSLTKEVAAACRGHRIVAVQDAYRLLPFAEALYGCDAKWWDHHGDCDGFAGEKWSSHEDGTNDKRQQFLRLRLHIVAGRGGKGFSVDPHCIHYGCNSGFQAVNLAILFGAARIVLVGFDMREVNGKRHFFGDHPPGFTRVSDYRQFISAFEEAAKAMPDGVEIVNATPGSALECFPMAELSEALDIAEAA
jgi:hypothetical protein